MDAMTARSLIDDAGEVRHKVRGDRRATSVPLFVFGAVTVLVTLLRLGFGVGGRGLRPDVAFDLVAVPIGFFMVALYYRHRQRATGVGAGPRLYVMAAVAALAVIVLLPFVLVFGVYATAGVALLVIAVRQRNLSLGVWAVVYGVVGSLEAIDFVSNRLYTAADALGLFRAQDGYFPWASALVYLALGASLIGAGLVAYKREHAGGRAVGREEATP
jgi:hypothetical protein